jgi:hypothetical protein
MTALAAAGLLVFSGACAEPAADHSAITSGALAPPLAVPPLDTLRYTAGFGELRANHVHAGMDLSTGGRVGAAVRAPLAGAVERVRTSGVGYGRSLYVRAGDGRLLVFGHLDAFAPALAAYVDSAQRAAERYEVDLWPAVGRFRFAPGDTIAWSGESGAGSPHLHFEIRHEDFALAPLRAGMPPVGGRPAIEWLTLEPLDERSFVARHAAPLSIVPREAAETLLVEGAVRAVVRTRAGFTGGADTPAWSTTLEWNGARIEARLDSISWAGEMNQVVEVYDRGRIAGHDGLLMWRPAGWTPRFLEGNGEWDGTIRVGPGQPARPLRIVASDANGERSERTVWLRGPAAGERGPDTAPAKVAVRRSRSSATRWSFASLPGGGLRVRLSGLPAGSRSVRFVAPRGGEWPASREGSGWSAVVPADSLTGGGLRATGRDAAGATWSRACGRRFDAVGTRAAANVTIEPAPWARVIVEGARLFEPGTVASTSSRTHPAPAREWRALTGTISVEPADLPLRRGVTVALALPAAATPARVDIGRREGTGRWEPLHARFDSATRRFVGETGELGEFALVRDVLAPRVRLRVPASHPAPGPYSRWQLVAFVEEDGSGIDTDASTFVVDGRRVPTEWDPEAGALRWRPRIPPAAGAHAYSVRAVDRAGNAAGRSGRFVLDSGSR